MEVPGGPHYPLLIIKGEHRGYAALTKRFNWCVSLLALCPLRSRIDRNHHYVLVHWCPSLSPCAPNRIIKTGCVIPCLLDNSIDMVMIPHSSLGWETKRPEIIS